MAKLKKVEVQVFSVGDPVRIKGLPGSVATVVGENAGRLVVQYQTERGLMEAQVKPFILEHVSKGLTVGGEINGYEDVDRLPVGSVIAQQVNGKVFERRWNQPPREDMVSRAYWYTPGFEAGVLSNWLQYPVVVLRLGQK